MSSKKKTHQECSARVSGSNICLKEKTVKKAMPVEEPASSDNNTADRISPSAMPLKKRPAKKTVQEMSNYQKPVHRIRLHLTLRNSSS